MTESKDVAPPELPARPAARRRRRVFYFVATAAYLALAVYGAAGPRGSDQFWYMSDVTTLIAGGAPYTNTAYPGTMIRERIPADATPFIHHTLPLYLAAALGMILGAYAGWIVLTVLATLVAAWLVSRVVSRLVDEHAAIWTYVFFLFWPAVFWQSVNMLQEGFFVLFSAAAVYLFIGLRKSLRYYLLFGLLLVVAVLCTPFFIPLLLLLPVMMVVHFGRPVRLATVLTAGGLLTITVAALALKPMVFPATFPSGVLDLIRGTDPTRGNMLWYGQVELPALTAGYLWRKVISAAASQFSVNQIGLAFYWPVNLTILASLILLLRPRGPEQRRLVGITLLLLVLYGGLIVCHQNQFRYGLFVLPATMPCVFVLASQAQLRVRGATALLWTSRAAVALALLVFLGVDTVSARLLRSEARQYAILREAVQEHLSSLHDTQHVILDGTGSNTPSLAISFAVYPRKTMIIPFNFTPQIHRQIRHGFPARWLIAERNSNLLDIYNALPQPEWRLPEPWSQLYLYRLSEPPALEADAPQPSQR